MATVAAGFPSPADDYVEHTLDLNAHLVQHPAATYFVRVRGQSMVGAGIHDGDLLIVDRALDPQDGSVVIAVLYGDLTVKRIRRRHGKLWLCPENDAYPAIEVPPETDFHIWGVVVHAIHRV
jgi:DNA polymerase V